MTGGAGPSVYYEPCNYLTLKSDIVTLKKIKNFISLKKLMMRRKIVVLFLIHQFNADHQLFYSNTKM